MPRTTTLHAVTAIGIDMGKNTLHLIGLDARGVKTRRAYPTVHKMPSAERSMTYGTNWSAGSNHRNNNR
jgi:hypothetical protein